MDGCKNLEKGKARLIMIGEQALFEFINESLMEHLCQLFDLSDSTEVILETKWVKESNSFIAVVHNLDERIELDQIRDEATETTSSLFSKDRYITIDLTQSAPRRRI